MTDKYILVDKKPVPTPDLFTWARWFEAADRHVKDTTIGEVRISTIFLGIDHSFGEGPPLLFETMIFGGPLDGYQDRCTTWQEAEAMHERACGKVARWMRDALEGT